MRVGRGHLVSLAVVLLCLGPAGLGAEQSPALVDETLGRPAPMAAPAIISHSFPVFLPSNGVILDDFNRADGPIGPDWTVHDGWCNVSSNAAVCGSVGRATFNSAPGDGNTAEADVGVIGSDTQYTGLLLNYGAGSSNLFLKVQQQGATNQFTHAACYTGNNNVSGFGLGFFTLDAPFSTAHMKATRVGDDVTIEFTNIDGGAQPSQIYVCSGAPAPEGTGIGILGYAGSAWLDNFGIGESSPPLTATVTVEVGPGGGGTVSGGGVYDIGDTATVTANPAPGWVFLHWLVNSTQIPDNPYSFEVTEDIILTAVFQQIEAIPSTGTLGLVLLLTLLAGAAVLVLRRMS